MRGERKSIVILLADDDEEDRMPGFFVRAERHLANHIDCVEDVEELKGPGHYWFETGVLPLKEVRTG